MRIIFGFFRYFGLVLLFVVCTFVVLDFSIVRQDKYGLVLNNKTQGSETLDFIGYDFVLNNAVVKNIANTVSVPSISPITGQSKYFNTRDYVYFSISKKGKSLGPIMPNDLVVLPSNISTRKILVSKLIVADLNKLISAASAEGLTLKVVSGFRSYEEQARLFNYYKNQEKLKNPNLSDAEAENIANTYSAKPGYSEHQLGTTVDVLSAENGFQFDSNPNLKYVNWLENNARKYNFRISYPQNSTEYIYEPWHLRWWPQ